MQADGDHIVTSAIWYTWAAATATLAAQAALPGDVFPNPAVAGGSHGIVLFGRDGYSERQ